MFRGGFMHPLGMHPECFRDMTGVLQVYFGDVFGLFPPSFRYGSGPPAHGPIPEYTHLRDRWGPRALGPVPPFIKKVRKPNGLNEK